LYKTIIDDEITIHVNPSPKSKFINSLQLGLDSNEIDENEQQTDPALPAQAAIRQSVRAPLADALMHGKPLLRCFRPRNRRPKPGFRIRP
jgi:hypothetical protein